VLLGGREAGLGERPCQEHQVLHRSYQGRYHRHHHIRHSPSSRQARLGAGEEAGAKAQRLLVHLLLEQSRSPGHSSCPTEPRDRGFCPGPKVRHRRRQNHSKDRRANLGCGDAKGQHHHRPASAAKV